MSDNGPKVTALNEGKKKRVDVSDIKARLERVQDVDTRKLLREAFKLLGVTGD